MEKQIDGKLLDAVKLDAAHDGQRVRVAARFTSELGPIDGLLQLFLDRDLKYILRGTLLQKRFGTDYIDVAYEQGRALVSALDDTAIAPKEAFDRLIARLARAVIDTANKSGAAVTQEPWWRQAQEDAKGIIARAYPKGL